MPQYDYRCDSCSDQKSIWRHIHMDPDGIAPMCDKCNVTMQRVWTSVGVIFKGNGWASKS